MDLFLEVDMNVDAHRRRLERERVLKYFGGGSGRLVVMNSFGSVVLMLLNRSSGANRRARWRPLRTRGQPECAFVWFGRVRSRPTAKK